LYAPYHDDIMFLQEHSSIIILRSEDARNKIDAS
jgi:hypothetical protein